MTGMTTHRDAQNASSTTASLPRRRVRLVAAVAALVALAAACGDDASGADTIETIEVTTPTDGATVGESFDVDIDMDAPIGVPDTGRQHLHFYYDVEPGAEDYDLVYELPFTTRELPPGEHTIHAVVANGDHSNTDVRQEFTVTVEPGATGSDGDDGGGQAPTPDSDSSGSDTPPGY
jgi:hypothetical protein